MNHTDYFQFQIANHKRQGPPKIITKIKISSDNAIQFNPKISRPHWHYAPVKHDFPVPLSSGDGDDDDNNDDDDKVS